MAQLLSSLDETAIVGRARDYLERIRTAQRDLEMSGSWEAYSEAKRARDVASFWVNSVRHEIRRLVVPDSVEIQLQTVEAVNHQLTRAMAATRNVLRSGVRPADLPAHFRDSTAAPA